MLFYLSRLSSVCLVIWSQHGGPQKEKGFLIYICCVTIIKWIWGILWPLEWGNWKNKLPLDNYRFENSITLTVSLKNSLHWQQQYFQWDLVINISATFIFMLMSWAVQMRTAVWTLAFKSNQFIMFLSFFKCGVGNGLQWV